MGDTGMRGIVAGSRHDPKGRLHTVAGTTSGDRGAVVTRASSVCREIAKYKVHVRVTAYFTILLAI